MATDNGTNKFVAGFDLPTLLDSYAKNTSYNINCHAIGTVTKFNSAQQTVEATINYPQTVNGKLIQYPVLLDVPVVMMQGGNGILTFPVAVGDTCLILFNDRDINAWFSSGNTTTLDSQRLHSLADGIALIGIRSLRNPVETYDEDRVELRNDKAKVSIGEEKLSLENDVTSLKKIFDDLLDLLAATTVAGIPLDDATLFTAFKDEVAELLDES